MIQRKNYLDKLISYKEQEIIKVVTGVRRCGKSTLFKLYIEYLKSISVSDDQIILINLEELENEELLNYKELYEYIKQRICKDKFTYILIDEIQNCRGFEKVVDSLFVKPMVDVYITGSNAYMLSGELATMLSGRYITIEMLPLSFKEYLEISTNREMSLAQKFNDYLRLGAFPFIASLNHNVDLAIPYIEGIFNTILIKDVSKREGISDIALLETIVKFLADSIGSPISTKKISDTINSSGRKISVNTVDNYLRSLTDSYIFYKVDRYDIKGRQHLKTLGKYYIIDIGIRNLLLSNNQSDIGHVIENIVFLELKRRGYRVSIGKLLEKEVDFIVKDMDGVTYFQVAATVLDKSTLQRELDPLNKISDNYPKFLLTLDDVGNGTNHNGIKQLNLIDWLLESI